MLIALGLPLTITLQQRATAELEREALIETQGIAAAFGARAEVEIVATIPPLRNDPTLVDVARTAAENTRKAKVVDPGPLFPSDDFAEFAAHVPSLFLAFGSGSANARPHHHPEFDLDEAVIALMAEVVAETTRVALLSSDER